MLVYRQSQSTPGLRSVLLEAERASIPVRWVGRDAIDVLGLSDHQGVAAVLGSADWPEERSLGSMPLGKDALVVILDGILDPRNFGACARAAEAAGAALIVVRKRRAAPASPAAIKASAGALLHLPLARVANLVQAMSDLKSRGFQVVGLDHRAPLDVHSAPPPERPLALVIGSEEKGLSRLVQEGCDILVSIPMVGRTESLNAASALAVGLFAYALRPATQQSGSQGTATMPARWRGAVR